MTVRVHGGNGWAAARQSGRPVDQFVDFSADLNPLGCPAWVRDTIAESVEAIQRYPDPEATAFRAAVAASHGIDPANILPGNGSAELIVLLTRLRPLAPHDLFRKSKHAGLAKVVVVAPTFAEYAWAVEQAGAEVVPIFLEEAQGFHLALDEKLWRARLRGADLVFLCNPNNPTGTLVPRPVLRALAAQCERVGAWLVVDEAFMEFVPPGTQTSLLPELDRWPHLVILRSLTKIFAVPGLRLGYLAAAAPVVERLRHGQQAWPLNTFALAVGTRLAADTAHAAQARRQVAVWREALQQRVQAIPGLAPFPAVANFLLCRLTTPAITSATLCDRLRDRGVLIRDCRSFLGLAPDRFVRMAVRTPAEHERLLTALHEVLADAG